MKLIPESFSNFKKIIRGNYIYIDKTAFIDKYERTGSRTPMQWSPEKNAGFTTGTPWLPVNRNYLLINAADQVSDPDSVYNYYRQLISLRHTHDVIVYGEFIPMLEDDPDVFAYARVLDGKRLTVLLNWIRCQMLLWEKN